VPKDGISASQWRKIVARYNASGKPRGASLARRDRKARGAYARRRNAKSR